MEKEKIRVLAIDDDPGDRELLSRHLDMIQAWDVELLAFDGWESARPELERRVVDVTLLDFQLGAKTGLEILKEIRDSGDERPVIMLTGFGDERVAAETLRAGADDYLVKSDVAPDLLRRAISNVMAQFQLRKEKALLAEELRQAQKMETIGALTGGIAHDFNNMLTGIMGYVEMARSKVEGADVEIKSDLTCVDQICRQMADLVRRLLNFSRREVSEQERVDLSQMISETEAVLRHTLPEEVAIDIDYSGDSLTLLANQAMLHQMLLNLSLNAAEAMPEGGRLTIAASKTVVGSEQARSQTSLSEGEYVLLEVSDTGVGMSAEARERIFEPFYTTKKLGNKKGTGLGLAVVWQNARLHGGMIDVRSEPGVGSTFRLFLPALVEENLKGEALKREEEEVAPEKVAETVLVVDDERLVRDLAGQMLARVGYCVETASDGVEATEIYAEKSGKIAAVLLDISMPNMDGKECLARLLELDPEARVIFSSGHDMTDEAEDLLALGACGVIQKPFLLADLVSRIRAAIDG